MAKRKSTNNDLQSITHQTKDRVTRTPLKSGVCTGRVGSSCTRHDTLAKTNRHDITQILLQVALNTINQTKPTLV
jgi:hypothetical protein